MRKIGPMGVQILQISMYETIEYDNPGIGSGIPGLTIANPGIPK